MQWQGQEIWDILFQKEDIFTVHDGTIMEKPCAQYEYIITDFFFTKQFHFLAIKVRLERIDIAHGQRSAEVLKFGVKFFLQSYFYFKANSFS